MNDTLFPTTGKATVRLLERLGHTVAFPVGQTCCGQLHANAGYRDEAIPLVRRFVDLFRDPSYDAIVTPSGSCAAMVAHHYAQLADAVGDARLASGAAQLAPRVYELSTFLVERLGIEDVGAYFPHRVTYHPSCQSLRVLRGGEAPLRLLRAVRGLELVELPAAETCCGFGGTFAVKNADTSIAMLGEKLRHIASTEAEVCTGTDNSCLLHIGGGLTRLRAGTRALHLAEILAQSERDAA